jgi:predicted metalloenzyme YecM
MDPPAIEDVLGDYQSFVATGLALVAEAGVDVSGLEIDHLCYRVSDWAGHERLKAALAPFSGAYAESVHNGRTISQFLLAPPLFAAGREIALLELPGPKEGTPYPEGLEHFEVVVPDFTSFCARYRGVFTAVDESPSNPTATLALSGPLVVKFHPTSLQEVVEREGLSFTTLPHVDPPAARVDR